MNSMTGCGQFQSETDQWRVAVEMKSVNNRYLDVSIKIPKQFMVLEEKIKKIVSTSLSRGKIDVFISIEQIGEKNYHLLVDKALALAYYNSVQVIADLTGLTDKVKISDIATYHGVLTLEKEESDLEALWAPMEESLRGALQALCDMRKREGDNLAEDIGSRIDKLRTICEQIKARSPQVVIDYREKLAARMQEILQQVEIDDAKLLNEVAFFADKADIAEELTRLNSHLEQFESNLELAIPIGRKLDFILQEINREINTIGSKANDMEINHLVIEAKSELEKIREQVQNVE